MKSLLCALCAVLLLQSAPLMAAPAPAKAETADSVKASMKDEMDKLKAQQKDQRDKLKLEQRQQLAKLKLDQKLRWQKFQAQIAISDISSATAKISKAVANP